MSFVKIYNITIELCNLGGGATTGLYLTGVIKPKNTEAIDWMHRKRVYLTCLVLFTMGYGLYRLITFAEY